MIITKVRKEEPQVIHSQQTIGELNYLSVNAKDIQ
jgi:hypothetical protein